MGQLIAVFRLMPEGLEVDLEAMKAEVKKVTPSGVQLQGWQVKPVAFGLKALDVTIIMNDEQEDVSTDTIEEAYSGIPGVGSVQCTDVGRL